jgi:PKD repeat protein
MRLFSSAVLGALVAGLCLSAAQAQTSYVIPSQVSTTEGAAASSFPWNRDSTGGHRIQYCYDSSHFQHSSPVRIQRLRWRADGPSKLSWGGVTHPGVRIDLSSAPVDYLQLTSNFANNHGPDRLNVYTGNVTVKPSPAGGNTTPGIWYVDITLSTAFSYDPSKGKDLLIDITLPGNWTGASSTMLDAITTGGAASRCYSFNDAKATLGTLEMPVAAVMEVTVVPDNSLRPAFGVDKTSGVSPLTVQFTDSSTTTDPSGITSWAWDFDGDNTVDSTLQNPQHIYAGQNKTVQYDVSLTVTDAANPGGRTLTKKSLITVDPVPVANFTATPTTGGLPLVVRFADKSTGAAQWEWDFDGDNRIDSYVQNPVWPYVRPGVYTVSLTVRNSVGQHTLVRKDLITCQSATSNRLSPAILQYQFNETRGARVANTASTSLLPMHGGASKAQWQVAARSYEFRGPEASFGALGNGAHVSTGWNAQLTGDTTFMFWYRLRGLAPNAASYFFGDGQLRLYTGGSAQTSLLFRGTSIGDMFGQGSVQADNSWHHFALVVDDIAGQLHWYIDGKLQFSKAFTPLSFAYAGATQALLVGSSSPSTGHATQHYDMDDFRIYGTARTAAQIQQDMAHELPTVSLFGDGCMGPQLVPVIGASGPPSSGNSGFQVTVDGAESGRPGILVLGLSGAKLAGLAPLPISLAGFYGPGSFCALDVDFLLSAAAVGGSAPLGFPVPLPSGLQGAHLYAQWLGFGSVGAVSHGLDINIQN